MTQNYYNATSASLKTEVRYKEGLHGASCAYELKTWSRLTAFGDAMDVFFLNLRVKAL